MQRVNCKTSTRHPPALQCLQVILDTSAVCQGKQRKHNSPIAYVYPPLSRQFLFCVYISSFFALSQIVPVVIFSFSRFPND